MAARLESVELKRVVWEVKHQRDACAYCNEEMSRKHALVGHFISTPSRRQLRDLFHIDCLFQAVHKWGPACPVCRHSFSNLSDFPEWKGVGRHEEPIEVIQRGNRVIEAVENGDGVRVRLLLAQGPISISARSQAVLAAFNLENKIAASLLVKEILVKGPIESARALEILRSCCKHPNTWELIPHLLQTNKIFPEDLGGMLIEFLDPIFKIPNWDIIPMQELFKRTISQACREQALLDTVKRKGTDKPIQMMTYLLNQGNIGDRILGHALMGVVQLLSENIEGAQENAIFARIELLRSKGSISPRYIEACNAVLGRNGLSVL